MATSMKKATTTDEAVESKPKRKFNNDDYIPCRSITNGELFMEGARSKDLYQWADYGDEIEVQYQDLVYDAKLGEKASFSKRARFIILDDDFINQNPQLNDVYSNMYTKNDLREILNLPVSKLQKEVESLPNGAKEALKGMVSTQVSNGTFDSVSKLKVLDEIFGTEMLQLLVG